MFTGTATVCARLWHSHHPCRPTRTGRVAKKSSGNYSHLGMEEKKPGGVITAFLTLLYRILTSVGWGGDELAQERSLNEALPL